MEIFRGTGDDRGNSVSQTSDGGFIITSSTCSYDSNDEDMWLINMVTYRMFLNYTRVKLEKLEDYENTFTLMNYKVESEDYEKAKEYVKDIIQLISDLKNIENQREELGVQEYSEEMKGIWDLWLEVWGLYNEYLDLLIDKKYSQAENKYDEYSSRYDDAFELESSETVTEANNEISEWYQNNIGTYSDLFEEYYEN